MLIILVERSAAVVNLRSVDKIKYPLLVVVGGWGIMGFYTSFQLTRSYIENHVHRTFSITLHARNNINATSPQLNQHTSLRQFHIAVLFTGQSRALT